MIQKITTSLSDKFNQTILKVQKTPTDRQYLEKLYIENVNHKMYLLGIFYNLKIALLNLTNGNAQR